MIQCKNCENELPPEFGKAAGQPCPKCGETLRGFILTAEAGDFVLFGQSVNLRHARPGKQSTAEADDEGRITLSATGPAPKNEEDALDICARLARALNATGDSWCAPTEGEGDIDGNSTNAEGMKLQMQVVRACTNGNLWEQIGTVGEATVEYDVATVAGEIIAAIRKKSKKYPLAQKATLALVLDAARTPSHTFQRVFDAFRAQHLQECQQAGFAQVWAVGPQDSIVARLDL